MSQLHTAYMAQSEMASIVVAGRTMDMMGIYERCANFRKSIGMAAVNSRAQKISDMQNRLSEEVQEVVVTGKYALYVEKFSSLPVNSHPLTEEEEHHLLRRKTRGIICL